MGLGEEQRTQSCGFEIKVKLGLGYGVRSNHEQGLGRTDITLTDKKNRLALVIEAKKSDSEGQMEKDCDEALDQIAEKKYAEGLKGYRQIECYGISFYQKSALVKKLQEWRGVLQSLFQNNSGC